MRRVALALVVFALFVAGGAHAALAAPGEIEGDLPSDGGLAIVTWGGGTAAALEAVAYGGGCDLRSAWVFVGGRPIGHVAGAPAFVNAAFAAQFPGSDVPAGTLMVLVCASGAAGAPGGGAPQPVAFEALFDGRVFDRPVELVPYSGGWLVAEQGGRIRLLEPGGERTFLDLAVRRQGNEEGLLSVALDPQFEANDHVWVYYSPATGERRTRLSRFTVAGGVASPGSELVVLEVPQPFANHNGGAVRFGPDGMLYLGLGDGGSGGDPQGNGQNPSTLLGSILRIDVRNSSAGQPYLVPSDNPFASGGGRGEVWAYGLRNPWRMAFDPPTGELWAADVGQNAVEEVNVVTPGGNYGWNILEGDRCFQAGCVPIGTVLPVATYGRSMGCSVTGGVVAGSLVPEVAGSYLFADFCSGRVWAMHAATRGEPVEVGRVDGNPSSFTLGPDGRVYLVQFDGPILRVVSP